MRGSTHSDNLQEAKPNTTQSQRYPVSARAYKTKDYEYLSTFSRMAHPAVLRTSMRPDDTELSQDRSDAESDLFMTASSTEYATSMSSASSTSSSAQSYLKYGHMAIIPDIDIDHEHLSDLHPDCHPQHQHQHHHHQHTHHHLHHHIQSRETDTLSSRESMENEDLEKVNAVKLENESNVEMKEEKAEEKAEVPGATKTDSIQVKEGHPRPRVKVKPRQTDTEVHVCQIPHSALQAAVLPKFGSWDTKNPSSGEAYTLIFRRLRDEKQSGGLAVCGSPTHPKAEEEEEASEPLRQESKEKEPLCSVPRAAKRVSSKTKGKTTSRKEPLRRRRWISCCKPSVLDD